MKYVALLAVILSVPGLAMKSLPDGLFAGKGSMTTPTGIKMPYECSFKIEKNEITAEYQIGPMKYTHKATAQFDKEEFLTLSNEGKKMGDGYCRDHMCHFDLKEMGAEETLVFVGNELHRIGSYIEGGGKLIYTEKLTKAQ